MLDVDFSLSFHGLEDVLLNKDFKLNANYEKYNLFFQLEHNLVLKEGINIKNIIIGNVKSIYNNDKYFVRIVNLENYDKYDYIIEYSLLNIENIKRSNKFSKQFIDKILYLPPFIYDINFTFKNERNINVLTNYTNVNQPRRKKMFEKLYRNNILFTNINNVFEKNKLRDIYDNTKILINIHQTPYHHTLEEFRLIPALSRGIVIISEIVPMKELLPYHDYIIWTTYDNIIETVKNTITKYDFYHTTFFGDKSSLFNVLKGLNNNSLKNIKDTLV
tara:strand:+ start:925 stop:1749 length:825 start_codon:yes stop_codon:yes gene_type:complete